MATAERAATGFLGRPTAQYGFWSWVTTVDHKRIGIMYLVTAFAFFIMGGIEALMIRAQLIVPENTLVGADTFNQLFTMHATTMIFLALMPMSVAFFNIVVPLQIGARDVAFPRLNALSYWIFLFGGIFLNASFLFGQAPDAGWFGYANLTEKQFNPGLGIDFWMLGLQILGVASMAGAFNFIVTIVNMRAPGLSFMRLPLFTWMTLVTSFLLILAFPVITVALIELMFDRFFGTNFFNASAGADPILWQHLFWLFGHPEVYILILPAMGVISEVLPTFSRKPLFGYPIVVYSGIVIGFMSWGVWAHHMFATGLGPVADSVFSVSTMLIGVPTGIKIFNWLGTLWAGRINMKAPLYYALGFIGMFTIGGLSGVMLALPPVDWQVEDTYFVVAHIHYVLFGGTIMGLFAGIYYWYPKVTGRLVNDGLAKLQFWILLIGFNLTFAGMHILGIDGMPRRIYTYQAGIGWEFWNAVATVGAFTIAVGVLLFVYLIVDGLVNGEVAGPDPWDGRTLEWAIASPPPHYNFAEIPVVRGRDPFWLMKYGEHGERALEPTRAVQRPPAEEHAGQIHMPDPSYFPIIVAFGLTLVFIGLITHIYPLSALAVLVMFYGIIGWGLEPVAG